jgi:glycosyltransferase involved in cell wall biosynthesis
MRIVHVARRFDPADWGGTETVILETSRCLQARGHAVRVVSTRTVGCSSHELVGGIRVDRFARFYPYFGLSQEAQERLDRKGGNPFSFAVLRNLLRGADFDLLHLHVALRLGGIGRVAARRRGVPYVVTLHGGWLDVPEAESRTWRSPTRHALDWGKPLGLCVGSRRVIRDAAAVVCVGRREGVLLQEKYPAKRILHLPNGVDAARFSRGDGRRFRSRHQIPASARVIACIARIDDQKNQALLLEALPAMREHVPDVHLLLVGAITNACYRARLEQRVTELDLSRRVTLIPGLPGASDELVDAYHASDVLAVPSIHEPFGIAILEAWAARVPVVASCVGGIPDLVEDGVDALLFPSGDQKALLEKASQLLQDTARGRALAERGNAKVLREYSWERVTNRLLALYDEVRSGTAGKRDAPRP